MRDTLRDRQPALFAAISPGVWRKPWVVHSKPVGSGEKALAYLARYIFRVALTDSAILHHDPSANSAQGLVVFRHRDGDTGRPRTARIVPQEFIRRFLTLVFRRAPTPVAPCIWPTVSLMSAPSRSFPSLQRRRPRRHTPNAVC